MERISTLPHTIEHVDPRDHSKVLRVEHTVVELPPSSDVLVTPEELARFNRIAVVRRSGLGDCLLLQPALQELKRLLPNLMIDLFIPGKWIGPFAGMPHLSDIRDVSCLDEKLYGRVVNCNFFVERHPLCLEIDRTTLFGRAFGVGVGDGKTKVFLTEEEIEAGKRWLDGLAEPIVGVCPWSARRQSDWPNASEFVRLYKEKTGGSVVLFTDRDVSMNGVDRVTRMGLRALSAVLKALPLLVTVDTGTMHLAFASGTQRVGALFGVASADLRIKHQTNYWAYHPTGLKCFPCDMNYLSFQCNHECMQQATAEIVMQGIRPFIGSTP